MSDLKEGKLPSRNYAVNVDMKMPMYNINSKHSYTRSIAEDNWW